MSSNTPEQVYIKDLLTNDGCCFLSARVRVGALSATSSLFGFYMRFFFV